MKLPKTVLDIALEEKRAAIQKSFKAEWAEADHNTVAWALRKHFVGKRINTLHSMNVMIYAYSVLLDIMGLPYTSGSSYAGLWVTNTEVYCVLYPGYKYEGFALSESGEVYAILWDKDENEILMPL